MFSVSMLQFKDKDTVRTHTRNQKSPIFVTQAFSNDISKHFQPGQAQIDLRSVQLFH